MTTKIETGATVSLHAREWSEPHAAFVETYHHQATIIRRIEPGSRCKVGTNPDREPEYLVRVLTNDGKPVHIFVPESKVRMI